MDPVALAVAALGAGLGIGLAVVGLTVAALDWLRPPPGVTEPALGAPLLLLAAGTLGGLLLAAVTTWRLLAPLDSAYRRGGLAMVSAFATVPLMQLYRPLHQLYGPAALVAVAALAGVAGLLLSRRARRIGAAA